MVLAPAVDPSWVRGGSMLTRARGFRGWSTVLPWWFRGDSVVSAWHHRGGGWCLHGAFGVLPWWVHDASIVILGCFRGESVVGPWWVRGESIVRP